MKKNLISSFITRINKEFLAIVILTVIATGAVAFKENEARRFNIWCHHNGPGKADQRWENWGIVSPYMAHGYCSSTENTVVTVEVGISVL